MTLPKLIAIRLLTLPVLLLILITLTFGLVALLPGDPATAVAGTMASPADIAKVSAGLGLDQPIWQRYVQYIGHALTGDLGTSFFTNQSVSGELLRRLPATLELVALSLVVAAGLGLALGIVGAYLRGTWVDRITRGVVTLMQSVPDFLLGLLLIFVVYFTFGLAPAPVGQLGLESGGIDRVTGFVAIDTLIGGRFDLFLSHLHHLMLPVLALGLVYSAFFGKVSRSVMASAFASPQVEFARACGLPERQVIRYAFLAARAPILTYGAILFGSLVGGAAIVETIFSWQGAGQWALQGILRLDIPVIQGFILAAGALTVAIYLLLDILVMILDPRVRY